MIGRCLSANILRTTGPFNDPSSKASPGTTAISTTVSMISADPLLRGASPSDCTMAQAMGAMMAVRTVIDGMPSASTNPMTKKAERIPA